jgi:hypothetical protein
VNRLGRAIARAGRFLGDRLFLGAKEPVSFLDRDRRIRPVVLDHDCRIASFLNNDLRVGGKRAYCARGQRDCEDIELHGRLL